MQVLLQHQGFLATIHFLHTKKDYFYLYLLNHYNDLINNLTTSTDEKFRFEKQDGKYGYIAKVEGADTFFPFSSGRVGKQYLGNISGAMNKQSGTLDISSILPNYQQLTESDFIMELASISGGGHNNTSASATSSLSYDPSTGIITCRGIGCKHESYWSGAGATVSIYYLYVISD